jgi:MFS family permease
VALLARLGSVRIDWMVAAAFTMAAVAGVLTGGRIADRIDAERSLRMFAAGLALLALFSAGTAIAALV